MGVPFISARKHYRLVSLPLASQVTMRVAYNTQVPGQATEPTSTIVLQSKDAYYVDIRILLGPYDEQKGSKAFTDSSLQWAFAGKSRATKETKNEAGERTKWHNVWDHWVDSHGDDVPNDEADMILQEDGTVLEEGVNVDAATGSEQRYEELWEDLAVDAMGKKGNKSSIVVRAEDKDNQVSGLIIKVGGWCQGILKRDGHLTVERWRCLPENLSKRVVHDLQGDESTRTNNDWVRTFRIGTAALPCETICSRTDGKIGTKIAFKDDDEIGWRVVEEYYY